MQLLWSVQRDDRDFPQGVTGIMIINSDGIAVRTTMDTTTTNAYSAVLSRLSDAARSAIRDEAKILHVSPRPTFILVLSVNRDLDPVNDISFIRMRSTKNEILLAPGRIILGHFCLNLFYK